MTDIKRLLELAKDKKALLRSNPAVNGDLLRRWKETQMKLGKRPPKAYELQRAFDDSAQHMARTVQARMENE